MCIITVVTDVHLLYNVKPTEHTIHVCPGRYHNMQIEEYSAVIPELGL